MANVKPCPFCGRVPIIEDCGEHSWFIRCACGIAQDKLYAQRCDAVRRWNRRKTEPQADTHLQRLQMCADCEHTDMCEWCYSRWAKEEPQTESRCDNCQEWDCYGCDYKQSERSE